LRIGSGFDAHRFDEPSSAEPGFDRSDFDGLKSEITQDEEASQDREIFIKLGGVLVPSKRGVLAHSDGDVILHALCDAILGALGLGDIGRHFPDTDSAFKDADSRTLLRACVGMMKQRAMVTINVDITLIAQAPRVAKYVDTMSATIASDLEVACDQVNVKATTTEKMGFIGRGEGLAAQAVILMESS